MARVPILQRGPSWWIYRKGFLPSRRGGGVPLHLSRSQIFAILEELKEEYPDEVKAWVESQVEDKE